MKFFSEITDVQAVFLAVSIVGLGILATIMMRLRPGYLDNRLRKQLEDATKQFDERLERFGEVNQIVVLMRELKDKPDLVEQLGSYSQQAVAAGLLACLNGIVADIATIQKELTKQERDFASFRHGSDKAKIAANKASIQTLLTELQQLNQVAEKFGVPVHIVK